MRPRHQHDLGDLRPPQAQRRLDAVHRVRGVGVQALPALLPHLARPLHRASGVGNSASTKRWGTKIVAVASCVVALSRRHQCAPPVRAPHGVRPRARVSWRSSLISCTATAGTNFRNSRNSVENRPMVPVNRHDVHPGRGVGAPAGGQEVPVQRGDDDVEALAPHADVDQQRGHPGDHQVGAELLEPEDLRHDDVAEHHQPEDRGERARSSAPGRTSPSRTGCRSTRR